MKPHRITVLLLSAVLGFGSVLWSADPALARNGADDGPGHDQFDDRGGTRPDGVSDDPPGDDSRTTSPTGDPVPEVIRSDDQDSADDGPKRNKDKKDKDKDKDKDKEKSKDKDKNKNEDKNKNDDKNKNRGKDDNPKNNQNNNDDNKNKNRNN